MKTEEEISKILDEKAEDSIGIYPAAQIVDGVRIPRNEFGNGWNAFICGDNLDNPTSEKWTEGVEACKKKLKETKELFRGWYDSLSEENKATIINLLDDEILYFNRIKNNEVNLHVNCNDLFYWGCADYEDITLDEIPSLIEEIAKDNRYGNSKWCCFKRGLRPQVPIVELMKKENLWTDELESLPAPEIS